MAKLHLACALILVATLAAQAIAHETFLVPVGSGQGATDVVLSSTEAYPRQDFGPKIERIAKVSVQGPDPAAQLAPVENGDKAMRLSLRAAKPGAYALALELLPRDLDLTPDKVAEYFAEIDASREIRLSYRKQAVPRQWHETYTKYSKSFMCVETCGDLASFEQPVGLQAEFILAPHRASNHRPGVILVRAGAPVANLPVAIFDGTGRKMFRRTGKGGGLPLPRGLQGTLLLSAVILEPVPGKTGTYRSAFATLTLTPDVLASLENR